MKRMPVFSAAAFAIMTLAWPAAAADDNAERGQRVYGACAPCHSLEPNRNMTGPTLAELWNRKAGSLGSFTRYSTALKSSGVVWNDKSLNEWIDDPQHFIPGNQMTFPGIKNAQQRADLLAFLRSATAAGRAPASQSAQGRGPMSSAVPDLKKLDPEDRVQKIAQCGDTYKVTTADGKTREFWERNLRFKTDVSEDGPEKGAPALVPAGMMGDRADVIFASPEEISTSITKSC